MPKVLFHQRGARVGGIRRTNFLQKPKSLEDLVARRRTFARKQCPDYLQHERSAQLGGESSPTVGVQQGQSKFVHVRVPELSVVLIRRDAAPFQPPRGKSTLVLGELMVANLIAQVQELRSHSELQFGLVASQLGIEMFGQFKPILLPGLFVVSSSL